MRLLEETDKPDVQQAIRAAEEGLAKEFWSQRMLYSKSGEKLTTAARPFDIQRRLKESEGISRMDGNT